MSDDVRLSDLPPFILKRAWEKAVRHRTSIGTIFIIDFFLAFTIIGWIVALAMAAGGTTTGKPAVTPVAWTQRRPPRQHPGRRTGAATPEDCRTTADAASREADDLELVEELAEQSAPDPREKAAKTQSRDGQMNAKKPPRRPGGARGR